MVSIFFDCWGNGRGMGGDKRTAGLSGETCRVSFSSNTGAMTG